MIKDLFTDLFSEKFVEIIKATVFERLWLLALSMKDKSKVSECGSVLNKSAAGDEYKWGFRFYILLIECFKNWSLYTEEFYQKYDRLKEIVPITEDDFYYPQNITRNFLDHSKVDKLLNEKTTEVSKGLNKKSDNKTLSSPIEILELREMKEGYLQSLFTKTPDVSSISDKHILLQSLYDSVNSKLSSPNLNSEDQRDVQFFKKFSFLHHSESIETSKGLAKLRQDVCTLMDEIYGGYPSEYNQFLGISSRSNSLSKSKTQKKEENVFTSLLENDNDESSNNQKTGKPKENQNHRLSDSRNQENRSISPNRNYEFNLSENLSAQDGEENLEKIRTENEKLKSQTTILTREIGLLKDKEKSLSQSMLMKSGYLKSSKVDVSPEILIEEIQKKNREYEALQAKYQSLMMQMNDKMKQDLNRTSSGVGRFDAYDSSIVLMNGNGYNLGNQSRFLKNSNMSNYGKY